MFERHPVAVWTSIILTLVTMAAGVSGTLWFINDERERSIAQSSMLTAISAEQAAIRKELALQTADLEEIRRVQGDIIGTVNRRLDKIEGGYNQVANNVSQSMTILAVEVGRVSGRQEVINLKESP